MRSLLDRAPLAFALLSLGMAPMAIHEPSLKRTASQAQFDIPAAKKQFLGVTKHHKAIWDSQSDYRRNAEFQNRKLAEDLLTRSITLALEAVGFQAAEHRALDSFRMQVQECMPPVHIDRMLTTNLIRYGALSCGCQTVHGCFKAPTGHPSRLSTGSTHTSAQLALAVAASTASDPCSTIAECPRKTNTRFRTGANLPTHQLTVRRTHSQSILHTKPFSPPTRQTYVSSNSRLHSVGAGSSEFERESDRRRPSWRTSFETASCSRNGSGFETEAGRHETAYFTRKETSAMD